MSDPDESNRDAKSATCYYNYGDYQDCDLQAGGKYLWFKGM